MPEGTTRPSTKSPLLNKDPVYPDRLRGQNPPRLLRNHAARRLERRRLACGGLGCSLRESSSAHRAPGLNGVLLAFLLGMAGATAIFLPFVIVDKGFFLYCGDYNSQQIPFYYYVHQFIKTGGGTWSWATDLGSSVVNSYSFYNFGSPFLWLSLIFPSRWMPYLMVPLFILKFGCIAASSCLYLSRYAKTRNMAVICSLAYAFCGFNTYNIFFNHMLDPVAIFPLMMWAMDGFVYEKRRGPFALLVGISLIDSYFFFIGNVVFLVIYFFVKVATKDYKITMKDFGLLVFEAALGVCIGMVLALPAYYNLIGNPRTDNFANGFGMVMYGKVQQYFAILSSMFLPSDPPYMPNVFTEGAIKWTSMSAFIPIIGMSGVFAYLKGHKGGAIKTMLGISLLMALVPILNSSFYAFNASYYARWYYMPLLIVALASLRSLEDADADLIGGIKMTAVFTGVFVIFGLLPSKQDDGTWKIGVQQEASRFWLTWLTAMFAIGIFYVIVRNWRGRVRFTPILLAAVMGFSVFYTVIHLSLGKFDQWERDSTYKEQQYDGSALLDLPENEGFYRIDTYGGDNDNLGLWVNKSGLQTFNSVVTTSIMEFYPMVGVKRDVSSKPEVENYALRGLLSVKYTIMPHDRTGEFMSASGTGGWSYYKEAGPFTVYKNDNFVPLGYTYEQYVTMDNLESIRVEDRAPMLMRAIGLDAEQEGRFRRLFDEGQAVTWELSEVPAADDTGETVPSGWYDYEPVDYTHYVEDCDARRASSSYASYYDASGFTCFIDMPRENLVFFAVPYDPGFSATVNGQEAEVLKVSGGMMAVLAPAGDNEIVFTYKTPGLAMGGAITLVALAAWGLYVALCVLQKRRVAVAIVPEEQI